MAMEPTIALTTAPASNNSSEPRIESGSVPGYEILDELGRGGMGVVYRAKQLSLNRIVALKMILGGARSNAVELDRFRAEAEVVGRIQHANIVQVYEVDEHDGQPYFTLEFCPNGSLHKKINGTPMPGAQAAELMEKIARAMHAAHAVGVIHRDLKPANVLLTADGTPKVTDFGIAKSDHDGSQTQTGAIMGTPSYMAPEQAQGMTKTVGPEADVYALGAILYECVTGRPPFLAENPIETIRQVVDQEPLPPRVLNRNLNEDLEKIILKCLEKDPKLRYPTSDELADDLRRFLDGDPITARSVNLLERLQRELTRSTHDAKLHPWGNGLMLLGLMIFAAHLLTSIFLTWNVPYWISFWSPRIILIGSIVPWVMRYRGDQSLMPTNATERLLYAVWIGYLISFASLFWTMQLLGHEHLEIYGPAMVLSGLAWFILGGYLWGGFYLIGFTFISLAPATTLLGTSPWTPALFGAAWGITLLLVGLRYRKLA